MPAYVNSPDNCKLSFHGALQDLYDALSLSNVVVFQDANGKYTIKLFSELSEEELVQGICPCDVQTKNVTQALMRFAATGELQELNRFYSRLSSVGALNAYCVSMKDCLKTNLLYSSSADYILYRTKKLPASLNELHTCFNGMLPPGLNTDNNIQQLNALLSRSGKYAQYLKALFPSDNKKDRCAQRVNAACPDGVEIVLDKANEDHEYAGAAAVLLLALASLVSSKKRENFTTSLKYWIADTFFPPGDEMIITYTEYATTSFAAANSLCFQLVTENKSIELGFYEIENDMDLDLTNEIDYYKDLSNPSKLELHPTKTKRPQNEGDDIR